MESLVSLLAVLVARYRLPDLFWITPRTVCWWEKERRTLQSCMAWKWLKTVNVNWSICMMFNCINICYDKLPIIFLVWLVLQFVSFLHLWIAILWIFEWTPILRVASTKNVHENKPLANGDIPLNLGSSHTHTHSYCWFLFCYFDFMSG